MTTTTTMELQDHVQAIVAGRIINILQDADEETLRLEILADRARSVQHHNLGTSKAAERHTETRYIPKPVIRATMKTLIAQRIIRVFKHRDFYFVTALPSDKQRRARAQAQHLTDLFFHGLRSAKEHYEMFRTFGELAKRISYDAAANEPELGDSSQAEDAYTFEGSVADSMVEAEIPSGFYREFTTKQARPSVAGRYNPKIAAQNTERAEARRRRRWLESDEGQLWLSYVREQQHERQIFEFGLNEEPRPERDAEDHLDSILQTI